MRHKPECPTLFRGPFPGPCTCDDDASAPTAPRPAGRENRDSPPPQTKWDVCRECRRIQNCVVVRGWHVCPLCLEEVDRSFTSRRAAAGLGEVFDLTKADIEAVEPVLEAALAADPPDRHEAGSATRERLEAVASFLDRLRKRPGVPRAFLRSRL